MPLPSVVAAAARYPAFGAQVPQTFMQSRDAPTGQSVCPARDSAIVRQPGAAAARCHDLSVGLPSAGFDDGAAAGYCSRAVPFLLPILPHEHERKPTKHLAPLLTSGKSSCTAAAPEWATRDLGRGAVVVDVGRRPAASERALRDLGHSPTPKSCTLAHAQSLHTPQRSAP